MSRGVHLLSDEELRSLMAEDNEAAFNFLVGNFLALCVFSLVGYFSVVAGEGDV